jgi:hypothetical protein
MTSGNFEPREVNQGIAVIDTPEFIRFLEDNGFGKIYNDGEQFIRNA